MANARHRDEPRFHLEQNDVAGAAEGMISSRRVRQPRGPRSGKSRQLGGTIGAPCRSFTTWPVMVTVDGSGAKKKIAPMMRAHGVYWVMW